MPVHETNTLLARRPDSPMLSTSDESRTLSAVVGGTLTAPALLGTADLVDAEVRFAGFPQLIDDINGRLRFGTDRIDIESLRATVGGGQVVHADRAAGRRAVSSAFVMLIVIDGLFYRLNYMCIF